MNAKDIFSSFLSKEDKLHTEEQTKEMKELAANVEAINLFRRLYLGEIRNAIRSDRRARYFRLVDGLNSDPWVHIRCVDDQFEGSAGSLTIDHFYFSGKYQYRISRDDSGFYAGFSYESYYRDKPEQMSSLTLEILAFMTVNGWKEGLDRFFFRQSDSS